MKGKLVYPLHDPSSLKIKAIFGFPAREGSALHVVLGSFCFLCFLFIGGIVALQCCIKFLLYNEVNQLYAYICPLRLNSPSPLGHHRAPS